jgi:SnoaL-like domain
MGLQADDRLAVGDLVHRYAAGVDDRQFDSVAMLFDEAAELVLPDPPAILLPVRSHRGREAIAAAVGAVAQTLRTEHAIVGEVYRAGSRPGIAHGRVTCVAHHLSARGDEFVDVVWHLRYDDQYELTGPGWRIGRRSLTLNAIETRPVRRILPFGATD